MTTALITGCASGFGERAALALARKGLRVAAGVRDFGRAQGLVDAAAREKLPVELVKLDVRSDESVAAAVADVHARMGQIDIAINSKCSPRPVWRAGAHCFNVVARGSRHWTTRTGRTRWKQSWE
jgi:NAD(P)-dependent dehydrogenase (short-subunit alcohol dehydrogenase family)